MADIFVESFETDGNGTRYTTSTSEFTDSSSDFFTRTDGSNISGSYQVAGADGSFFFAAQDIDGEGAASQQTLEFSGIDISGFSNLGFSALFAEDDDGSNQDWDLPDFVSVEFQIDGGGFQNLLAIESIPDGDPFNAVPAIDTDFDGDGDGTEITSTFAELGNAIAGTGSSLDLRFTFDLDSGDEDIAVDLIKVTGDSATPTFVINEVDADTPSFDTAEFVEIYDGGVGNASLDGLTIVFFNGSDDASYEAFDLDGFTTNSDGFFVLGNPGVANVDLTFDPGSSGALQNGADAVALYEADATDFPNDTPVTTANLLDAVVYDTNDSDDSGLLNGLGQSTQFNEDANNDKDNESNSRVPDGTGSFVAQAPTPGAANAPVVGGPTLAIAPDNAVRAEGDAGTTDFTFTVTRSGDTSGATSVDFAVTGSADAADFGGMLPSGTVNFAATETTQTITVSVSGDTDVEADEDFTVTLSNPSGGATVTTASADGTIQNDDIAGTTLISAIQGSGAASPLVGNTVTVEAIVVGDFQDGSGTDGDLNGFFVQEEDSDSDGNAATSEGLFIFDGNSPAVDVNVGDKVQVTGTVTEFFGETQLSGVSVTVIDNSDNSGLVTPATVTFPVASTTTNSDGDLIADLEAFEGMVVTIPQELTVADLFTLGRFGDMGLYADGRLETFTQSNAPSVAGFQAYQDLAVRNTVILDDGSTIQNPTEIPFEIASEPGDTPGQLDANDQLRSGDTVENLTGVVRFGRGSGGSGDSIYRINPTESPTFVNSNPRSDLAPDVGGDITVASFNVLNFFTSLDDDRSRNNNPQNAGPNNLEPRGANDLTTASTNVARSTQAQNDANAEFDRQVAKLVAALSATEADIFSLVELENEFGDQNGDGQFSIEFLVDALNAAIPGANYQFVDPGQGFIDTGDAISVGLIYDANTVAIAPGTTVEILDDSDLPGLGLGGLPAVFDGPSTNRAALATTFQEVSSGETFTVAANHFKSKGSPGTAGAGDQDLGDGVGAANQTRLNGAIALDAWLDTDPTGSGDSDVLIVGDLNAYGMEDPIQYLLNEGYEDQVKEFLDPGEFEYSFGFPVSLGTSPQVQAFGALDYALATSSLASQVTGAAEWHINADESVIFDYNLEFKPQEQADGLFDATPFRSSDHDPVVIGLDLQSALPLIEGTERRDRLNGTDADERIEALGGNDRIIGAGGDDDIFGGDGNDQIFGDTPNTFGVGGDDFIDAGDGNDIVRGNSGNDTILGGDGLDRIFGGEGDDVIRGGLGDDILKGDSRRPNLGNDTFVLAAGEGTDTILDFQVGEDSIGLADSLAFGQLSFSDLGNAAEIALGSEILAVLNNVAAADLTAAAFVTV